MSSKKGIVKVQFSSQVQYPRLRVQLTEALKAIGITKGDHVSWEIKNGSIVLKKI